MAEMPATGHILIYANVRNPDARAQLTHLLESVPGERISATLYEVNTVDWDEGLWDEEVERMLELIDPDTDTLVYWQASGGELIRTCIAGHGFLVDT